MSFVLVVFLVSAILALVFQSVIKNFWVATSLAIISLNVLFYFLLGPHLMGTFPSSDYWMVSGLYAAVTALMSYAVWLFRTKQGKRR